MNPEHGEFVGVDNLHFAEITKDDEFGYSAKVPEFLAPTAEIAGQPTINKTPTFYDNKPANTYTTEGVTELTFTISGIPIKLAARLLGKDYDPLTGRMYDDGVAKPPDVAVGFRYNKGESDYTYYWYLKGKFSGGSEDAASKTDNVNLKTYQLTFTAVVTTHNFDTVNGKKKPQKRHVGETTDPAFNEEGWFLQVQTPENIGKPDALALSSITPDDDSIDVAVDVSPIITFNNPIDSEYISIISGTGEKVEITKTWDADKKNLTIAHSTAFANATKYNVVVSGVKDEYGQELQTTIKSFTTVA